MGLKRSKKKNKDIDLTKPLNQHKKRTYCLNALAHWFLNLFVKSRRKNKNKQPNVFEI